MKKSFLIVSAAVFVVFFFCVCPASGGDFIWNEPAINLSVAGQDAYNPQVTMDETGNAVAVWYRYDGSNYIVQESHSSDYGATWSAASDLSVAGQDADSPQVTMDETGHAVAVWYRDDGSKNYIVQESHSSDYGATWSAASDLSAAGQFAYNPQVTMDETGNAVAVWRRYDGSNNIVQESHSSDYGATWSAASDLSAAGQNAASPQVTMDETGNAVAVWRRYDGSKNIVQESHSSDYGATWSAASDLSVAGQTAYGPQVTMDETGNAVAVWYRYDGSKNLVQESHSSDYGATWSAASDLSVAGQDADSP